MRALLHALGFLTRLPVPPSVFGDARAAARSPLWYPLVGLLLGLLLCVLGWSLQAATPWLRAALLLLAWVVLTGALHLDGLADSADAWIGGLGDRERTLAIMKDPRCGPAGVVALVLLLLLKFAALASLSSMALLWLAPLLARAALTALLLCTPYARSQGMAAGLRQLPPTAATVALGLSVLAALLCGPVGWLALLSAAAVFWLWRRAGLRRLGGFTGDTAGALAELVEVIVLVVLALH